MPISMPKDTRDAIGANANNCESRSLFMDRLSAPQDKDTGNKTPRRDWFNQLLSKPVALVRNPDWIENHPGIKVLYAQLQARLMVNMAGGVMENAGLCLDRFGLPYIPGSAVKGCARRAALAALEEWTETGVKPGTGQNDKGNLFTAACESFNEPLDMLSAIARVFGWCEQDWTDAKSDFAWACGAKSKDRHAFTEAPTGRNSIAQGSALGSVENNESSPEGARRFHWNELRLDALRRLALELHIPLSEHEREPWKRLPNFAGSVSFLPAYTVDLKGTGAFEGLPLEVPKTGKLELDVVTCHHPDYYSEKKDSAGRLIMPIALDTEDPNPVVFPAVAPGHVFVFAVGQTSGLTVPATAGGSDSSANSNGVRLGPEAPTTGGPEIHPMKLACAWLACGLQTFGIGAKTSAGYGWFECSEALQSTVVAVLSQIAEKERDERRRREEKERAAREEQERIARKREEKKKLASMSPEEMEDSKLNEMQEGPLLQWIEKFDRHTEPEQQAIYRLLQSRKPELWRNLRRKSEQGKQKERKRFAPVVQAMFKMAKERKEKMPT